MVLSRNNVITSLLYSKRSRCFAQVVLGFISSKDTNPPPPKTSPLDDWLLKKAENLRVVSNKSTTFIHQYETRRGQELRTILQGESHPSKERAVQTDSSICPIFLIAHIAKNGSEKNICVSSGFRLQAEGPPVLITCAHTLEEIRSSTLLDAAGTTSTTCIIADDGGTWEAAEILSSLPRHDLLILRPDDSTAFEHPTLPVSPYPAPLHTPVAAHFLTEKRPDEDGWTPCFEGMLYRKWVTGTITGYKDFAGNATKPGTYDSLPHMFFTQVPTPGSSGGPVIDLDTGAVVGIIRGSRLDNRVAGLRGWSTSSESIYEMFALPGIVYRS